MLLRFFQSCVDGICVHKEAKHVEFCFVVSNKKTISVVRGVAILTHKGKTGRLCEQGMYVKETCMTLF